MAATTFANHPKILRGAFVEFGLSLPPLFVVFQFNPVLITRTRTASVVDPAFDTPEKRQEAANQRHIAQTVNLLKQVKDSKSKLVTDLRLGQSLTVSPETISFDIRLDATDKLDSGDFIAQEFGIAPQLSTLELMITPKSQSIMGEALAMAMAALGASRKSYAFFSESTNPPIILFVWGRKKVLPVNITSMTIKEEEFSTDLNPTRATITVSLEVLEGPNLPFIYSKTMKEVMSLLNLANILDIANTMVPQ